MTNAAPIADLDSYLESLIVLATSSAGLAAALALLLAGFTATIALVRRLAWNSSVKRNWGRTYAARAAARSTGAGSAGAASCLHAPLSPTAVAPMLWACFDVDAPPLVAVPEKFAG